MHFEYVATHWDTKNRIRFPQGAEVTQTCLSACSSFPSLSVSVFWWAAALNLNGLYTESEFEEQLADIESMSQETV